MVCPNSLFYDKGCNGYEERTTRPDKLCADHGAFHFTRKEGRPLGDTDLELRQTAAVPEADGV